MAKKTDVNEINLASIYRELSDAMQQESKEFKKIMGQVKEAAKEGKYTVKVEVDYNTHQFFKSSYYLQCEKTDLAHSLTESGFNCSADSYDTNINFWGKPRYYIHVSWRKKINA